LCRDHRHWSERPLWPEVLQATQRLHRAAPDSCKRGRKWLRKVTYWSPCNCVELTKSICKPLLQPEKRAGTRRSSLSAERFQKLPRLRKAGRYERIYLFKELRPDAAKLPTTYLQPRNKDQLFPAKQLKYFAKLTRLRASRFWMQQRPRMFGFLPIFRLDTARGGKPSVAAAGTNDRFVPPRPRPALPQVPAAPWPGHTARVVGQLRAQMQC
jgi:hypothetical protein